MKLKIIACGVFEPELAFLATQSPHEVNVELLEAGLHEQPEQLRKEAQAAIERADAEGFEAIGLVYGLCGRGTAGLKAVSAPVIIPRAHDCMTLFLGSRAAFRQQFAQEPGTFYITAGWYESKVRPLGREHERHYVRPEDIEKDPRFAPLAEKYGPERAAYIIHFHDSWKRNYTRAAYIDTGHPHPEKYQEYARQMAEDLGWRYETVPGDLHLLRKLVKGEWNEEEFLILRPGQRSAASGDENIFTAIQLAEPPPKLSSLFVASRQKQEAQEDPEAPKGFLNRHTQEPQAAIVGLNSSGKRENMLPLWSSSTASSEPAHTAFPPIGTLGLGIDAGGTYTDCVLYDLDNRRVIAKAKAITTHHHLLIGIEEGLQQLQEAVSAQREKIKEAAKASFLRPGEASENISLLSCVQLVALSTTLATNAIVEGKGGRPGAIIMTPLGEKLGPEIRWQPIRYVSGALDIRGNELAPPIPSEIEQAVQELLAEGVDAFAISGYASVRNPAHELLVRDIIRQHCPLPVICGHELSQRLDFIARANTAILNARLLSLIGRLLDAVKACLRRLGISAPLMIVKGDGSLINEQTARERPVETILSGPAASVSGARHLTDVQEGLVFDMGGTTTDSAKLRQGLARVHPEGALVGGWRTSVEATHIHTIGLGGDSHITFNAERELLIGPRRVWPICYLAAQYPSIVEKLQRLEESIFTTASHSQMLEFFLAGRDYEQTPLEAREQEIVRELQERGPLSRAELAHRLGLLEPSLLRPERLENLGFVQRAALTPTDLLHVTGEFTKWNEQAAQLGLHVFAQLYGATPEEIIQRVKEEIVKRLCRLVLEHILESLGDAKELRYKPNETSMSLKTAKQGAQARLGEYILDLALASHSAGPLEVSLTYKDTIVALGAPVQAFFPEVARRLNARLIIPEHADVANAIGAVASEVVVREKAIVRPGDVAAYVVHSRRGKQEYERLEAALQAAQEEAGRLAAERAARQGAAQPKLRISMDERRGLLSDGQEELIEVIVEATAYGRPLLLAAAT